MKQLLHTAVKTRLDALNTASKKVVQKVAEKKTGDFIGNKIVEKNVKQKTCSWCIFNRCW